MKLSLDIGQQLGEAAEIRIRAGFKDAGWQELRRNPDGLLVAMPAQAARGAVLGLNTHVKGFAITTGPYFEVEWNTAGGLAIILGALSGLDG